MAGAFSQSEPTIALSLHGNRHQPQSQDASGFKLGTLSWWHHERASHLSQFSNLPPPPPHPHSHTRNHPTYPCMEDSLRKRQTRVYTQKYQPAYSLRLYALPSDPAQHMTSMPHKDMVLEYMRTNQLLWDIPAPSHMLPHRRIRVCCTSTGPAERAQEWLNSLRPRMRLTGYGT